MNSPQIEPLEARIAPAAFSISAASVSEGNSGKTALSFTVTLDGPESVEAKVDFATADGTAGSTGLFPDYEAASGTLTFAAGETSKTITVQVLGDVLAEGSENFSVQLSNPVTSTIAQGTATGTITSDGDTAPGVTITSQGDVTEGGSVVSKFTVTLSAAPTTTVTVAYATGVTADSAKPGPGAFTDYTATTGTLTFTPSGALTQEISVPVLNDSFAEDTEQFAMTLTSATNAQLSTPATAVGRILNDTDTEKGFTMGDLQIVEGSTESSLVFTPTFSAAVVSTFNLTLSTQAATAAAGTDFTAQTATVAFAPGQKTGTFTVKVKGDAAFEAAESFYVNVTGVPAVGSGVTLVNNHPVNPTAQVSARGYILDDDVGGLGTQVLRWTDIDGDLVTLRISKGSLFTTFGALDTSTVQVVPKGTVGGRELLLLNLNDRQYAGTNVSITAERQIGFPGTSNGRVDVGFIQAASFITSELQVIGVDLGTVTIDGDLAKITAGDSFSTPAIRRLDVYSLGVNATTIAGLQTGFRNTQSDILGPITTLNVKTDVQGFVHVIGAEFGTIGTLNVGGTLKGGTDENSGRITASGRIVRATLGAIEGGSGLNSGLLSGTNLTNGTLGSVVVKGNVQGGSGGSSGAIFSSVNLASVTIGGDLIGGTGAGSGGVVAGGTLSKLLIEGDIRGGDNTTAFLDQTGFISVGKLTSATIKGNITAGKDVAKKGLASSGSIRADVIGALTIEGDVLGHASEAAGDPSVPAIISASGINEVLAIKSLKIGGKANHVEILAGYSASGTAESTAGVVQRGTAVSGDASIGAIVIGSDVQALNVVAGAKAGANGRFGGTGTNAASLIPASLGVSLNNSALVSKIASLTIGGAVATNTATFGVTAQSIGVVKFGTTTVPLLPGPFNDTTAKTIGVTGSNFVAIELGAI